MDIEKAYLIFFILWVPQALSFLSNNSYWIQTKEYRFDRITSYLKTGEGIKKTKLGKQLFKILILIFVKFWPVLFLLLIIEYLIYDLTFIRDLFKRNLRKPFFTSRVNKILATALILEIFVIFYFGNISFYLTLFWMEVGLLIFPLIGIYWTEFITKRVLNKEKKMAIELVEKIRPKIVAITGSYGKSTTKEFVANVLASNYKIVKTPETQNTLFGLVRTINRELKGDVQILVAEMAAYKTGEINELCTVAKPDISIITGIEEQHLDLFGSIENIKKGKYEIIKNLKKDGIAIFNLNNVYCQELYLKTKKNYPKLKTYGYFVENEYTNLKKGVKADIVAKIIDANIIGVKYEIIYEGDKYKVESNLNGSHFVENSLAAVLVARLNNIEWKKIINNLKNIKTIGGTMKVGYKGKNIIIDDSHNSTPIGFRSALNYMNLMQGYNKYTFTSGILELGSESKHIHKDLGRLLSIVNNKTFVTSGFYAKMFKEGFKNNNNYLIFSDNPNKLLGLFLKKTKNPYIVLLEGRMPSTISNYFLEKS